MAGVALLLGGSNSKRISGAKRLTAEPGTQRANARAITSAKAPEQPKVKPDKFVDTWEDPDEETTKQETHDSASPDVSEESLTPAEPLEPLVTTDEEAQRERTIIINEALNDLRPERGIERLREFLQRAEQARAASRIYTALGKLYTHVEPPDIPHAEESFDEAIDRANDVAELHEASYAAAGMFHTQNRNGDAIETLTKALKEDVQTTLCLQLRVMLGGIYLEEGALDNARDEFAGAIKRFEQAPDAFGTDGEKVYGQACQMLARALRLAGEEEAAAALVERFRKRYPSGSTG